LLVGTASGLRVGAIEIFEAFAPRLGRRYALRHRSRAETQAAQRLHPRRDRRDIGGRDRLRGRRGVLERG
jgi:hypothetical protein